MMVNCPVCGKLTAIYYPEFWVYRRKDTFYCSENCMIVDETRDLKLMNLVARDRRLRKEAKKMGNHKLTLEQKKKAVEIASQGGNPTEYLKKCGSKNPYAAWDYIQKTLAKKIKAEVMAIPQIKVQEPKPVLAEKVVNVPEPVGGGEWEKLPDVIGNVEKIEEKDGGLEVTVKATPSAAEAIQNMQDAADKFFRQCGEMGLKMDGPAKKEEDDDLQITIRSVETKLGTFHYDDEYFEFRSKINKSDNLEMPVEDCVELMNELPKVMRMLGVAF